MGQSDDTVLRESLKGLREEEKRRSVMKKEGEEERVQRQINAIEEEEKRLQRRERLVAVARDEKMWPLSTSQVIDFHVASLLTKIIVQSCLREIQDQG